MVYLLIIKIYHYNQIDIPIVSIAVITSIAVLTIVLIIVTVTVTVTCIVLTTKRKHMLNRGILHVVIYSLCTSIDVVPQSTDNEYVLIYICVCYIIVFSYVSQPIHNVQTLSAVNNIATVTVSTPTHENPYLQYRHEVYILIHYILYTVGTQFDMLCSIYCKLVNVAFKTVCLIDK